MPKLTTAFAGSPALAAVILKHLLESKFSPVLVLTQPDRPTGRGRKVKANPVKQCAMAADLPVAQPATLRDPSILAQLTECQLDVLVVAAYGLILPSAVLAIPKYGCINVHASLLPRWRGAAPIERAIMAGDAETGVCIMHMEEGLDTGPIFARQSIPITAQTHARDLSASLAEIGAKQLIGVLKKMASAKSGKSEWPQTTIQNDDQATYAHKLSAADRIVDWSQSAAQIARQIIALADRLPVRVRVNDCGVQFLAANVIEQNVSQDESSPQGTLIDASKSGLIIQCATDLLQVTALKVERGKGKTLDPAAAINGFKDLFYPGARFVAPS